MVKYFVCELQSLSAIEEPEIFVGLEKQKYVLFQVREIV